MDAMKKNGVTSMSTKELRYMQVCIKIENGVVDKRCGADLLEISYRQMLRIYKRYSSGGPPSLCHRSRGRPGIRAYPAELRQEVMRLIAQKYFDFNPTYLAEELLKTHDIRISAQTLRRWMRQDGVGALTGRRSRPQRRLRPRKTRFGLMVQGDGSFHRWFGAHRPPACLIVLIDDATNVVQALFAEQEYTTAVLTLLRRWVQKYGVPGTLYFDRRNTYVSKPAKTIEEQLAGVPHDTPFTRTCRELGIRVINANSPVAWASRRQRRRPAPQAKGRVERANRTLQDRLIPALRLNDLTTIDAANHFLTTTFLREFNDRFAQPPEQAQDAHLPLNEELDLDRLFSIRHTRTVTNAWTIRFKNHIYQLTRNKMVPVHPSSKVEVSEHLDGSVHIYYKDMKIKEVTKCDIFNVA